MTWSKALVMEKGNRESAGALCVWVACPIAVDMFAWRVYCGCFGKAEVQVW